MLIERKKVTLKKDIPEEKPQQTELQPSTSRQRTQQTVQTKPKQGEMKHTNNTAHEYMNQIIQKIC